MRKIRIIVLLLMMLSLAFGPGVVFGDMSDKATLGGQDSSGNYHWRVDSDGDFQSGNGYYTWDYSDGQSRQVDLNILGFYNDADNALLTTTTTTGVYFTLSDSYGVPYAVMAWEDNAESASPIAITFRVPDDYRTSATFVVKCKNASVDDLYGKATPNYIDWDIVINTTGSATSTTRYDQTPVTLSGTTNVQDITLTYATPTDISAGDLITLRIWPAREAGNSSTGRNATSNFYVFGVAFRYTAQW